MPPSHHPSPLIYDTSPYLLQLLLSLSPTAISTRAAKFDFLTNRLRPGHLAPGALSSLVIFVIFVFFSLLLLLPRLDTAIYRLCAYLLRINGAPRPLPPFIMHPRAPFRRLRLLLDSKIIFGSRLAGGFGSATVRAVLLLLFALLCYLSCLVMGALAHVYL